MKTKKEKTIRPQGPSNPWPLKNRDTRCPLGYRDIWKVGNIYYWCLNIFTFYYICAVVRATDTTCVLQEVYEGHISNTSNVKYRDLCRGLIQWSKYQSARLRSLFKTSSVYFSGRNSDVWEIRVRIQVRATRNLRAESRVSSEWPPPAAPESRVSPEWPKPQTAESRVSEKKTRDSLVTRRAYSDPTERVPNTELMYIDVLTCWMLASSSDTYRFRWGATWEQLAITTVIRIFAEKNR